MMLPNGELKPEFLQAADLADAPRTQPAPPQCSAEHQESGCRGQFTGVLQRALEFLDPSLALGGERRQQSYGRRTILAVRDFQRSQGLALTGVADAKTIITISRMIKARNEVDKKRQESLRRAATERQVAATKHREQQARAAERVKKRQRIKEIRDLYPGLARALRRSCLRLASRGCVQTLQRIEMRYCALKNVNATRYHCEAYADKEAAAPSSDCFGALSLANLLRKDNIVYSYNLVLVKIQSLKINAAFRPEQCRVKK